MPFDEQTEAEIIQHIRKDGAITPRNTTFKVRKDMYNALSAKGVPQHALNNIVGTLIIHVPDSGYGGEIYNAALEVAANNIAELWKLYSGEFNEQIALLICQKFSFSLPIC